MVVLFFSCYNEIKIIQGGEIVDLGLKKYLAAGQLTVANLVLQNYHTLGMTEAEFILYLQITSYLQRGQGMPNLNAIAQYMHKKTVEVYGLVQSLLDKKLMNIEQVTDRSGRQSDNYSFALLEEKLFALLNQAEKKQTASQSQVQEQEIYRAIEVEFGRALTPMEVETISMWFKEDHYQPEIVKLALREAVMSQAPNLKYMDKILLSWEKQNIKTVADVQRLRDRRFQQQNLSGQRPPLKGSGKKIPLKKWTKD